MWYPRYLSFPGVLKSLDGFFMAVGAYARLRRLKRESQLDVIDADRSVLLQRRIASQLEGERARAAVGLIRALGGGWDGQVPADISDAGPDQPLHARNP